MEVGEAPPNDEKSGLKARTDMASGIERSPDVLIPEEPAAESKS